MLLLELWALVNNNLATCPHSSKVRTYAKILSDIFVVLKAIKNFISQNVKALNEDFAWTFVQHALVL